MIFLPKLSLLTHKLSWKKISPRLFDIQAVQYFSNLPSNDPCSCGLLVCLQDHCPALKFNTWSSSYENNSFLAPYQGSDWENIDLMLDLADFKAGESVLDIGAGDGRLLIRSLQRGASKVEGWEIHPETYELGQAHLQSVLSAKGLSNVKFVLGNGLNAPIMDYDIVLLYLIPEGLHLLSPIIKRLQNLGSKNHKPRIIVQGWPIEELKPIQQIRTLGGSTIYRYLH